MGPAAEPPNNPFTRADGFLLAGFPFLAGIFGERNCNILKDRSPNLAADILRKVLVFLPGIVWGNSCISCLSNYSKCGNGRRREMCKTIM